MTYLVLYEQKEVRVQGTNWLSRKYRVADSNVSDLDT